MILSYSRMMYVEFTTRMHLPELIACHQRAFEFFGGWPRRILYDNMKQVKLSATEWNPLMMDFLSHHGIAAATHRPYRPRYVWQSRADGPLLEGQLSQRT